jgi:uncharacterized repeat protein (TIGR04138 family)
MSSRDVPFWDAVDRIRTDDPRFRREAYGFVMAALGTTVQGLSAERLADAERRHLSGQELLTGIVNLARREFGPMARTVFSEWGVRRSGDFGAIVFQLVASGQLSARPTDRPEDFENGADLTLALTAGVDLAPPAGGDGRINPTASGPSGPA